MDVVRWCVVVADSTSSLSNICMLASRPVTANILFSRFHKDLNSSYHMILPGSVNATT